ncbi:MAG: hypothetical protein LBV03_00290 [Fusobacteriales bacterium]|jgi:hypothetical protein|nr:hypothetical protein [Fusobacteriales bacterium]
MNKEWSDLNKLMQVQLKKESTFEAGIETLLSLRQILVDELYRIKAELGREDFNMIPFMNVSGYHSKTIAYSIWHISRIEDIVAHTIIKNEPQIFFSDGYKERIGTPVITTGNELAKQDIADFSKALNLEELYRYMTAVKDSTNHILKSLHYRSLKQKMSDRDKEDLRSLNVVSTSEKAYWLIDFWYGKTIRGLIQMSISRHWIMHVEAILRIRNKITPIV